MKVFIKKGVALKLTAVCRNEEAQDVTIFKKNAATIIKL